MSLPLRRAGRGRLLLRPEFLDYQPRDPEIPKRFVFLCQKAVAAINAKNVVTPIRNPFGRGEATRLAKATLIIGHCYDHCGQMVEYVRMNGSKHALDKA
jgi:hypothetical protein